MTKKILTTLLLSTLIFSLVGCNDKKVETKNMNSIDINFNTKTVSNGTVDFDYPSDEWVELKEHSYNIPILLIPAGTNSLDVNINVMPSEDVEMPLEKFLESLPIAMEQLATNSTMDLMEIRSLNNIEIAYNENTIKYTEENIEKGLKKGTLTEQVIEQSGGREALLNIPEKKQIQMTFYLDKKDDTITGTYLDDSQKEMVLKAMTTMVQTAKLK